MDDLMKKIMDESIGGMIDKRTNALLLDDTEYQKDCRDLELIMEKLMTS